MDLARAFKAIGERIKHAAPPINGRAPIETSVEQFQLDPGRYITKGRQTVVRDKDGKVRVIIGLGSRDPFPPMEEPKEPEPNDAAASAPREPSDWLS